MRVRELPDGLTAGRDLVRQTALLAADDLSLPELFERLAALLSVYLDVATVYVAIGADFEQRYEFQVREPAVAHPATIDVAIPYGNAAIGRLTVALRGERRNDADAVMLETCALYLGARLHDERQRAERERYKELALTDGLTGLANRRAFDEALEREWRRGARSQQPLSLLLMDVDLFKVFNDTYGHLAGDACLRQVASSIASRVKRPGDVAARYGGEEFAVILPETAGENAATVAESIAAAVRDLGIPHQGSTVGHVTLSIGCTTVVPSAAADAAALIKAADEQLYRAKEGGRNRVAAEEHRSDAPAAFRTVVVKHNVPPSRTTFVGRDRDLASIEQLFLQERLITIAGSGGSGKTRLARELIPRLASQYSDGAWFVDLASVASPDVIPQKIASAIFPVMTSGVSAGVLTQLMSDKEALLILDNAEHVIDACAEAANALLDAAPRVKLLVTSREPLAIDGERVYPLGSLAPDDALNLFEQRACAAGMAECTPEDRHAIAAIAQRVDFLPLAIELMASRAASIALDELLEQLEQRLSALQTKSRSAPARHQTLEAVIDWSYRLLSDSQRTVLRCASVFSGGCDGDALRAVCEAAGISTGATRAAIEALTAKSLMNVDAEGRIALLELPKAFALDQLRLHGEERQFRRAHAAYYRGTLHNRFSARDEQNYYAAVQACCDLEEYEDAVEMLWHSRLHANYLPGMRRFAQTVHALLERPGMGLQAKARAALFLSSSYEKTDRARAEFYGDTAMELFTESGDGLGWAWALWCRHNGRGDRTTEEPQLQKALALARESGEYLLLTNLLMELGINRMESGQFQEGLQLLEAAQRACDPNDVAVLSMLWSNTALAHVMLGDYNQAADLMKKTVASLEERVPWGLRFQLVNLGLVELLRGDYLSARDALRRGIDSLRRYPGTLPMAQLFDVLALLAARTGSSEAAVSLASFAQAAFDSGFLRQPVDQAYADDMLARLRAEIDEETFARLWQKGRAMTFEQAAALASTV